jgi:hypothetical protein
LRILVCGSWKRIAVPPSKEPNSDFPPDMFSSHFETRDWKMGFLMAGLFNSYVAFLFSCEKFLMASFFPCRYLFIFPPVRLYGLVLYCTHPAVSIHDWKGDSSSVKEDQIADALVISGRSGTLIFFRLAKNRTVESLPSLHTSTICIWSLNCF